MQTALDILKVINKMITIFVNIAAVLLMGLVVWWFWMAKPERAVRASQQAIDVLVENGVYTPAVIQTTVGSTVTLRFLRKDKQPCSATVVFGDLDISAELPIEKPVDIKIRCDRVGEFEFTCQMGMYRGILVVE